MSTTLTSPPCDAVVARLFAEADASDARLRERRRAMPQDQQPRLAAGNSDYRALYSELKDFYLAVSRETARLLYVLARASRASSIVEFGTSFGISTLHLAAALRDNGGGRLIGTEFEAAKVAQARANIAAAGLEDLVEVRGGTRCRLWPAICRQASILCCWTGPRICIPPCSRSSSRVCVRARCWSPTTPIAVRTTLPGSATRPAATCPFPLRTTLSSA